MSLPSRQPKILFLAIAFAATGLLPGCAHKEDDERPWHKKEPKWYQSDMDSQDRQFFLGSFLDHGER